MATQLRDRPTLKATRFLEANRASPVVYASSNGDGCVYRLEDGQTFNLTTADCVSMADIAPRWRHLSGAKA